MAKARGLSGLKPPLALSPPPPAAGSTLSTQRRIRDHEHEIPRQRLENQETVEGIRCSRQRAPADRPRAGRLRARFWGLDLP